ncbi:MAG TPA: acylphosphatase [bacterium]|nr:acylphosphatase [bacterium]
MRAHLWIRGLVQGVGFRFFAVRAAQRYGVSGFVRNLPDGRVEAVAEGLRGSVEAFLEALRRGPAGALVRDVDVQWEAPEGRSGFEIR